LFIGSSFVIEFLELPLPKCNPNLFDHFFNPYIHLNLEEFCILASPYFSLDPIVHLATIVVVSFTSESILCPTFVILSCAHDYVLSLTLDVFVSSSSFKLTLVSNTCDLMVFGYKLGEFRRAIFWILMRRKLKMLIKAAKESTKMLNFGQKMCLMNGEFFVVLIQQDQLLIFQRMNLLLRIWLSSFILRVAKKDGNLYPPTK